MKKILTLLIVILCFNSCSEDEPPCDNGTFVGNVFLETQADVDEFGAKCFSKIEGNLRIGQIDFNNDITDISSLSSLKELTIGRITIYAYNLASLNGLQNLTKTGGLRISYCDKLKNIDELSNLKEIGDSINFNDNVNIRFQIDDLIITNCGSLESIKGLQGLNTVNGIHFDSLFSLLSLEGLEYLITVGSSIQFGIPEGCLDVSCQNAIIDFCALQNLFINGNYNPERVIIYSPEFSPSVQDIIDGNCKQ